MLCSLSHNLGGAEQKLEIFLINHPKSSSLLSKSRLVFFLSMPPRYCSLRPLWSQRKSLQLSGTLLSGEQSQRSESHHAVSGNLGSHTSLTPCEGKVKCQKDPLPKFQQVHSHFSSLQALSAPFFPAKEPFNSIFHTSGAITGDFSVAPDCKYVSCHSLGHHTVWCILLPNTQASILMPQKMSMTHNFFVFWENVTQKLTWITKNIVLVQTSPSLHFPRWRNLT